MSFLARNRTVDPEKPDELPPIEVFINPVLTFASAEKVSAWEGCLSFQELLVLVPRHLAVLVEYLDASGNKRVVELTDFAARVVQHENDHLDGIVTLDRAVSTFDIVKASEIEDVVAEREEVEG